MPHWASCPMGDGLQRRGPCSFCDPLDARSASPAPRGTDDGPRVVVRVVELRDTAAVADHVAAWQAFLELVSRLGLTVLTTTHHVFPGGGLTGVVVVGESHAAIHTWPERRFAWLELATCGDPRALDEFEAGARARFGGS